MSFDNTDGAADARSLYRIALQHAMSIALPLLVQLPVCLT